MSYLDRVTQSPDEDFSFGLAKTHDLGEQAVGYTLELHSQTWRSAEEVSHPLWTHNLQIVRPKQTASRTAMLLISGGSRKADSDGPLDDALLQLAEATGSVCVLLPNVPNQPLAILDSDDPEGIDGRYEDDLIAQSWLRAIDEQDPDWVVQTAMVKSAIAAMDATQQFLADQPDAIRIDDFVVTGASKRGWTTWLTAAVDSRIRAVMPIVIDTFNMPKSIRHHWGAYGDWSPAIADYTSRDLFQSFETRRGDVVRNNVDPYLYRDRYTMPKFLLNSAGDQYFLPDSTTFYLDQLPGETRLRYMPNTDHDLDFDGDDQPQGHQSAVESLVGFYKAVEHDRKIPKLTWTHAIEIDLPKKRARGTCRQSHLSIKCDTRPTRVTLWQAYNPDGRDFRQSSIGNAWVPTELAPTSDYRAAGSVDIPEKGFRAYFIEVILPVRGQEEPVTFTTPVFVVPDELPYKDKPIR
ncbi:MAG: PhoPQ-activated protein PqaA family protein [Phycisphaerales bacterium JB052]